MPTKKPRLQTIVEEEIYKKFKKLCEEQKRSESQMLSIIIEEYFKNKKE